MERLQRSCEQLGISLSAAQLAQFELYFQQLVEWNQKFNLTAITEYEEVQSKHFVDSLIGWPLLAEEMKLSLPLARALHVGDVGTGAGFPGIPLKILVPRLKLTLIDGTGKKIEFLRHLAQTLALENVEFVQGRAEEIGRMSAYRGQFDVVTARAVAPLNTLVEWLLPLVRQDGMAMIYKGANAAEEFNDARRAIPLLGGETVRFSPVQLPFLEEKRFILFIKKVRPTSNLYPRGQGLARKKPL